MALTHFLKVPVLPEITCTGSCEHQVHDCIQCLLTHVIYNFQWQRQDTEILLFQLQSTNTTKTAETTSASKAYSISSKLQPSHSNLFFKRVKNLKLQMAACLRGQGSFLICYHQMFSALALVWMILLLD